MRAVNLMPGDSGWGRHSRSAGSSPAGAYIVLGVLAALVVFASLYTIANNQIDSSAAKLAKANAEAQAAEQRVPSSTPYQEFATLARSRKATIISLSATRFDWAHGLREVARVVPDDVWLTAINGSSGASDAAPDPTTSAAPVPRFEMKGCTRSQAKVARLIASLRAVDGVRAVELKTSAKPDERGGEDCPANRASDPTFTIVISFGVPGQTKAPVDSTGQIAPAQPAPASPSASAPAAAAATPKQPATPTGSDPR